MQVLRRFLFIASCSFLFLGSGGDASLHHAKGDRLYREFDNYGALEEYTKAYQMDPRSFETLVRMARVNNDIGRSMLRRNDSAEVWYLRAIEYAQQLVDLYPEKSEAHFWLAVTEGSLVPFRGVKEKLDIGKAVTKYARRSIEIDSTFGPAYMVLGIIYREGARLKWYERLIANTIFGGSLPGTLEESEQMLLKAIRLDPENLIAYHELSRTYDQMGNSSKGREYLETIATLVPRNLREKELQERAQRQLERLLHPPPSR